MSDFLVTALQLSDLLGSAAPPTVLDVRWRLGGPPGSEAFGEGHVPGAAYCDLDLVLADPPGVGGRHPLPDPQRFGAAMRALGVSAGRAVVVMDGSDAVVAARAWWLLKHHGHRDVRVLSGGFAAWVAAGLEVSVDFPIVTAGDFIPSVPGTMTVLDAEGAADMAKSGVLLDARATPRFRGEHEPVDAVAGHIPGAVNAPTLDNVNADGSFLEVPELVSRFAGLGVQDSVAVGVYCGSGVTAAHEILALMMAGHDAALYAGSWSEWIQDSERPIEVGP